MRQIFANTEVNPIFDLFVGIDQDC